MARLTITEICERLDRAGFGDISDAIKDELEQRDKVIEKYETAMKRAYKRRGSSHPNVVEAMRILAETLENSDEKAD